MPVKDEDDEDEAPPVPEVDVDINCLLLVSSDVAMGCCDEGL